MALVAFDIESIEQDFIDVATIEDSGPRLVPANVPQISYRVTVRRNTITGTTPLTTQELDAYHAFQARVRDRVLDELGIVGIVEPEVP